MSGVTLDDALAYCAWLSQATGMRCRLPSEAEWEKAAATAAQRGFTLGPSEWTSTAWGERASAPDPAYRYPWRADGRDDPAAAPHLRRVIRGVDARRTARRGERPDQVGPPGARHGFRVVMEPPRPE
jgi:hypothetical protein